MEQSKGLLERAKIVPILGWFYLFIGLIIGFIVPENTLLELPQWGQAIYTCLLYYWWFNLFCLTVVHFLQLWFAIPIGIALGIPVSRTITKTMIYGATWWKPLKGSLAKSRIR